jgi:hypothetical protein
MLDSGCANLRSHPVRTSGCAFSNCKQPWLKAHAGRQASNRVCGFGLRCRASTPQYSDSNIASEPAAEESAFGRERTSLNSFADTLRGQHSGNNGSRLEAVETQTGPVVERAFLVGVAQKGHRDRFAYNIHESLEELGRLAETAGLEVRVPLTFHFCPGASSVSTDPRSCRLSIFALYDIKVVLEMCMTQFVACSQATHQDSVRERFCASSVTLLVQVVGQTFQNLENVSPRTYIGSGKTLEVEGAVDELDADTVIFDDELTPGQLRNLERAWGDNIRLCDRTALILDIFSQRAATKEGQLQVCLLDSLCPFSYDHLNHTRVLLACQVALD